MSLDDSEVLASVRTASADLGKDVLIYEDLDIFFGIREVLQERGYSQASNKKPGFYEASKSGVNVEIDTTKGRVTFNYTSSEGRVEGQELVSSLKSIEGVVQV